MNTNNVRIKSIEMKNFYCPHKTSFNNCNASIKAVLPEPFCPYNAKRFERFFANF